MATATYWQRGESLDYTNTTSSPLAAGSIVKLQSCIGIVEETIAPNATGAIAIEGVFEIAKTGTAAITIGDAVYFDGSGITNTATSNLLVGYAAESVTAEAKLIKVKLKG